MAAILKGSLGGMDIKHELIYREDDVLLVKSEPQLHSPRSSNGTIMTSNLLCANNGLTTLAGTSMNGLSNVTVVPSNGLSSGVFSAGGGGSVNKRPRTDDWMSSPSPGTISVNNVPPLTPSPGPPSHPYTVISNGYSSPMSSGSYDPYSPNGKIGEYLNQFRNYFCIFGGSNVKIFKFRLITHFGTTDELVKF